ncbi:MAG TPA: tRNA lysidine(34) synthetase TilS [Planctomycetaceae bacterium]|nr:tRNA lysidine(34) synthetase TilS [Planctomycetaceae bacterium]
MPPFLSAVRDGCHACGITPGPLLVGVSGGADSVALIRALVQLREELQCEPTVVHLNHRLRAAADEDARWVQTLCDSLSVSCRVETVDIAAEAARTRRGIEETARSARRQLFEAIAADITCTQVAVAHTADDQVETILHHLVRGTGIAGLRGMAASHPLPGGARLVRPMLSVNRSDVLAFLRELGQSFREDETNSDERMTRNRIRHELLPLLESAYNPAIRSALLRLGEQAGDLEEFVAGAAEALLQSALVDSSADVCRLEIARLAHAPRHLARECFVRLWRRQNWPRQGMGFVEWNRLADVVHDGRAITLPGRVRAERRHQLLVIERLAVCGEPQQQQQQQQ